MKNVIQVTVTKAGAINVKLNDERMGIDKAIKAVLFDGTDFDIVCGENRQTVSSNIASTLCDFTLKKWIREMGKGTAKADASVKVAQNAAAESVTDINTNTNNTNINNPLISSPPKEMEGTYLTAYGWSPNTMLAPSAEKMVELNRELTQAGLCDKHFVCSVEKGLCVVCEEGDVATDKVISSLLAKYVPRWIETRFMEGDGKAMPNAVTPSVPCFEIGKTYGVEGVQVTIKAIEGLHVQIEGDHCRYQISAPHRNPTITLNGVFISATDIIEEPLTENMALAAKIVATLPQGEIRKNTVSFDENGRLVKFFAIDDYDWTEIYTDKEGSSLDKIIVRDWCNEETVYRFNEPLTKNMELAAKIVATLPQGEVHKEHTNYDLEGRLVNHYTVGDYTLREIFIDKDSFILEEAAVCDKYNAETVYRFNEPLTRNMRLAAKIVATLPQGKTHQVYNAIDKEGHSVKRFDVGVYDWREVYTDKEGTALEKVIVRDKENAETVYRFNEAPEEIIRFEVGKTYQAGLSKGVKSGARVTIERRNDKRLWIRNGELHNIRVSGNVEYFTFYHNYFKCTVRADEAIEDEPDTAKEATLADRLTAGMKACLEAVQRLCAVKDLDGASLEMERYRICAEGLKASTSAPDTAKEGYDTVTDTIKEVERGGLTAAQRAVFKKNGQNFVVTTYLDKAYDYPVKTYKEAVLRLARHMRRGYDGAWAIKTINNVVIESGADAFAWRIWQDKREVWDIIPAVNEFDEEPFADDKDMVEEFYHPFEDAACYCAAKFLAKGVPYDEEQFRMFFWADMFINEYRQRS